MAESINFVAPAFFSFLSDDIVLNIFTKLESDPRDWARVSCVSIRFSSLIKNVCYRYKCSHSNPSPSVVSELSDSPGSGAALYKLLFCCPGLLHAGILLENSDFGLEREIGPDEMYHVNNHNLTSSSPSSSLSSNAATSALPECWSLFDDLYFDMMYDTSESQLPTPSVSDQEPIRPGQELIKRRKRQWVGPVTSHLASGAWNLSREQGNKLLASRFRADSLYICDWPGCVHAEEKRKYMLFRGIFKNFKSSRVWRAINVGKREKIKLDCAVGVGRLGIFIRRFA